MKHDHNADARVKPAEDPAFLARVTRYLEDGLDRAELDELERELAESDAKREAYFLICLGETLLLEEFQSANPAVPLKLDEDPLDENVAVEPARSMHETMIQPALRPAWTDEPQLQRGPTWIDPRPPVRRHRRFVIGGVAAAVLLTMAVIWTLVARRDTPETLASVSRLTPGRAGPSPVLKVGESLKSGQSVALAGGCVELNFPNYADVIVEGPARLTLESRSALRLDNGRIVVKMAAGKQGFVVHTPAATVTDLGTEFGVDVLAASKVADVHVFEGRVKVAPPNAPAGGVEVAAGDAAEVASGAVTVAPGGVNRQLFVRDLGASPKTVELADLISRGDGLSGLRGGVIDQSNGTSGTVPTTALGGDLRGDGKYHRVTGLPGVDGTFMPGPSGAAVQVDSANNSFTFDPTVARGTVKICAGGVLPKVKPGDTIRSILDGVDYASAGHSFLFIHPSAGITFDLDAIRRLHPNCRITAFQAVVGNSSLGSGKQRSNVYILVDGTPRHSTLTVAPKDAATAVRVPLSTSDRFLTLATTSSDSSVTGHQVLFGDPTLSLEP